AALGENSSRKSHSRRSLFITSRWRFKKDEGEERRLSFLDWEGSCELCVYSGSQVRLFGARLEGIHVQRTSKVMLRILVILLPATLVRAQLRQESIQLEKDVAMRTRDGVVLRADVYRPGLDGKFPVLLQRNPYNKDRWPSGSWPSHSPVRLASQGYVVIIQD